MFQVHSFQQENCLFHRIIIPFVGLPHFQVASLAQSALTILLQVGEVNVIVKMFPNVIEQAPAAIGLFLQSAPFFEIDSPHTVFVHLGCTRLGPAWIPMSAPIQFLIEKATNRQNFLWHFALEIVLSPLSNVIIEQVQFSYVLITV